MAASKKNKQIKQKENPKGKSIAQGGNPEQYYSQNPAWTFANADKEMWAFSMDHIGDSIWSEILPRLQALETQTWGEILLKDKKKNHLKRTTQAENEVLPECFAPFTFLDWYKVCIDIFLC